jgi:DNA-binding transcriptional regulator of glucitol operon
VNWRVAVIAGMWLGCLVGNGLSHQPYPGVESAIFQVGAVLVWGRKPRPGGSE